MTLFERLRALLSNGEAYKPDPAYSKAIEMSNDLIDKMRKNQDAKNPVTALMADIWMQRHNIPYMTTVYEAVQEVDAAVAWSGRDRQEKP